MELVLYRFGGRSELSEVQGALMRSKMLWGFTTLFKRVRCCCRDAVRTR